MIKLLVVNFENSKQLLKDIKLELPETPSIADFNKFTFNRDTKIQNEIIKPKDDLIEKLYNENIQLHKELKKQLNIIDKAYKIEKENKKLKNDFEIERIEYEKTISKLQDINLYLNKAVKTLENTLQKLVSWVCKKFSISSEDDMLQDFQMECNTFIDVDKQIQLENLNELELDDEEEW